MYPPPNKMDQEIASPINRALFHQEALAHMRIINAKRNARESITAITHQNVTAAMALIYRDVISTAAHTVDTGVINIQENESWERLKIHAIPHVSYKGKGTEGLQKMRDDIHANNQGITIPVQVRWLANPHIIRERRQKGEISAFSVVFVVQRSKVERRLLKVGIKVAGVWYRVEPFTIAGPDSRCEHCCRLGHIQQVQRQARVQLLLRAAPHQRPLVQRRGVHCTAGGSPRPHTREMPKLQRKPHRIHHQVRKEGRSHQSGPGVVENRTNTTDCKGRGITHRDKSDSARPER